MVLAVQTYIKAWLLLAALPEVSGHGHLGGIPGISSMMLNEGFVGFDNWWKSNTTEIEQPLPLKVEGSIPTWLSGSLVRNGPGLFEQGGTKVNHQFDGLSKITKFSLRGGQVTFQVRFLRTPLYNETMKEGKFPPHMTMVPAIPALNFVERVEAMANANKYAPVNIFIWRTGDAHYATDDSCHETRFDLETLDTMGMLKVKNNHKGDSVTGAHKQPAFAKEDSGVTCGWQGSIEMPSGKVMMSVYIDSEDLTRQFIGKVETDSPSVVHSFGVTENYVIVVVPSLEIDVKAAAEAIFHDGRNFSGLSSLSWRPDKKSTAYVFDAHSKDPTKAPIRTFELEPMYFNHHINAWEEEGRIVMDLIGYSDGSFITNPHGFANLEVEVDQDERRRIGATTVPPEFRRYRLDMQMQTEPATADFETLALKDAVNGFSYRIEMPRFNDRARRGKSYCHVYAMASHIQHMNDSLPNVVKADLCNNGSTVEWYEPDHYPSEPIFVPRPGAADEDDGVVLAVTLDGPKALTYLLVIDAKSMRTLAKVYTPVFQPYDVHGQFFPDSSMYAPQTAVLV